MITVEPTTDIAFIDSVMHDPSVLPGLLDDSFPNPQAFSVGMVLAKIKGVILKISEDGVGRGWLWFIEKGQKIYEAHTALLTTLRGSRAVRAVKMCVRWLFDHTDCEEIRSYAMSDAPQVLLFAKWVGLNPYLTEPYPVTRQGKEVSITWLSVSRAQFLSTNT
jgi:hypothetical protein